VRYLPELREHTLANMRDQLLALQQMQEALARGDYDGAAKTAERRLGMTLLIAHGAHEVAKYMPKGMQDAGTAMHRSASRFAVSLQKASITGALRKPLADLRDLSLMEIDVSAAKRLTIANGKDRLVLEKDGETWKVAESSEKAPEKFEFDPMAVSRRLAAIRTARAVGIASGDVSPDKAGLDKPSQTVSITSADDRAVTLAFGKDTKLGDAAAVYARGNADGEIYAVTPFTRDNVLGGIQTFAKREDADSPLAGLDPKALGNLPPEIRDSLMKQIEQKRQQQATMKRALEKAKTQDSAQ